jgi:competence CoiA-like predicted nuclease
LQVDLKEMPQKSHLQQTVKIAIDCMTGEVLLAESLLTMTDTEFTALRREAMTARIARRKGDSNAVRFQCAICKNPLFLSRRIGGVKNRWFTHDGKSENCPWYEGNHLTPDQTKALIYRGQQEGADHRRMKQFIAHWLENDPTVSQVSQEQTTFSEVVKGEWRCPDVKCLYRGIPLVFEIQLSYTFLSDVIARDDFYRREGIFIIWVFSRFDLSRAAVADEAFFNRRNLFVLDKDAINKTIESKALTFNGHHQVPQFRGKSVHDVWTSRLIGLGDVTFPEDTLRPYFFDYDAELKRLEAVRLEAWQAQQNAAWVQGIQDYLKATIEYCESDYSKELKAPLLAVVDQLYDNRNWHRGYEVLRDESFFGYHSVLPALLSIRFNKPIGYKVKSVFQVIESGLRNGFRNVGKHAFAILYLWAYKAYRPTVSDKNRQWLKNYAHKVKRSIDAGEETFRRYAGFDEAIELLFPELEVDLSTEFGIMPVRSVIPNVQI